MAIAQQVKAGKQPAPGWPLLVGAVMALALVKEILARLGHNVVATKVKTVSRRERVMFIAVLFHALERVGSSVLGVPGRSF
jgi:hypothetical protein